ncbi:MAG: hypothetical protein QF511_09260 [Rhodospirillales bacterium]|jgi:hypothetical protein|nr:hypothetical protein [Rhodospirillales bacterium]HIJ43035.1 hypothetical protein [Rhodospirillaceae bacterium]HIJ92695.1 hypothetical protein [Rhodospirillaceae bacterium]
MAAPNPFDPDSLRITGDVNTIGAKKILLRIPVRKPNRQEFFRVNTDPDYRLLCAILELKDEREFYVVTPEVLHILAEDARHVELLLCQNRQGVVFFWPLAVPDQDGRRNSWHESSREAAKLAEANWIRMVANMSEGGYSVYQAKGNIPEPQWPAKTLQELLELAFKEGKRIDSRDHPVVQQLYGE